MNNIPLVRLGDICWPKQHPTLPVSAFKETGFPVFGANGPVGFYDAFTHAEETIAITCRGATCGTVNITPARCYITGNAMALDNLDKARVDLHFLARALRFRGMSDVISGSAQPQITRGPLLEIKISLPPLNEQRRIAAILDEADALRAKRRAALAQLDEMAQAIFVDMFGDPIKNSSTLPVRQLSEVIDHNRPITYGILMPGPDVADGVPYVRVVDMVNGSINLQSIRRTTREIANEYRRSTIRGGDLLISIRGHVGRVSIAPMELDGANITQDTARLAVTGVEAYFLQGVLESRPVRDWLDRRTKGAAVQGINLGDLRQLPVIIPERARQLAYTEKVKLVRSAVQRGRSQQSGLDSLFASLQHRAFRGEL